MESIPNIKPIINGEDIGDVAVENVSKTKLTPEEAREMQYNEDREYLKNHPVNLPEKRDNVSSLETTNAKYRLIYSVHTRQNNPEDVAGSDAIVLEVRFDYHDTKKSERTIFDEVDLFQQYGEVIKYAAQHSIPIFFVDLSLNVRDKRKNVGIEHFLKKVMAPYVGVGIGYKIFKSLVKDLKQEHLTRRSFLKILGKTLGAAYLGTPAVETVSGIVSTNFAQNEPDENSLSRKFSKTVSEINENIHPELKSLKLEGRNFLIAEKSELIAVDLSKKIGSKPKVSIIIGAAHVGIEKALKMTESDRAEQLKKYLTVDEIENEETVTQISFENTEKGFKPKAVVSNIDIK